MELHTLKYSVLTVSRALSQSASHSAQMPSAGASRHYQVLQSSLSSKSYIDRVTKKANSMLGFLRRILKIGSQDAKSKAYLSTVRSNFEYCCSVWNPHHKDKIKKIEMVQRRAARLMSSLMDTRIPTAYRPCSNTCNGNLLNREGLKYSYLFSLGQFFGIFQERTFQVHTLSF